jgi:hypothetical protein
MQNTTGSHHPLLRRASRRTLLGAAGIAAAGFVISSSVTEASAATLVSHNEIGNQPTYYHNLETDAITPSSFSYDPTFYGRVETWFAFWRANTPAHWTAPHRICLNGVYVNKAGAHGEGRAMDLGRLDFTNTQTGQLTRGFDGRHNVWQSQTGGTLTNTRKLYWGTVASLIYHFRDVLHYAYNADHDNHAHADNSISGTGNSNLVTSSVAQTTFVQSALTYIWGYGTSVDGNWGPQTDGNSRNALSRIGVSGALTTSQANWLAFCRATFRFAVGTQSY